MAILGLIAVTSMALTWIIDGRDTAIRGPLAAVRSVLASGAPTIVVEGNQLVEADSGRVFVPRGVNVPGFEYACAQGWGHSEHEGWLTLIRLGDELQEWGANTVRLPLNLDCWLGIRGAPVSGGLVTRNRWTYRAAVRAFVDSMRAARIVVILDLHSRKRQGVDDFGLRGALSEDAVRFWRSAAAEYADVDGVMFDLINEPHSRYDDLNQMWASQVDWECWAHGGCQVPVETDQEQHLSGETYTAVGMAEVVEVIRAEGATQPILLGGLDWANDLSGWLAYRPDDTQLVAAAHLYETKRCNSPACYDAELAPIAASVPLLISEVGEADGDTAFMEATLNWAGAHGVGYLAWAWTDDPYDPWSLLSPEGEPVHPVGTMFRDRLLHHSAPPAPAWMDLFD